VDTEVARQAVVEDSAVEQLEAADSAVVVAVVDSTVEAAVAAVAVDMVAEATGKF
jgi:hypothetical protein